MRARLRRAGPVLLATLAAGCGTVTSPPRAVVAGDAASVRVHLVSPLRATLVQTDSDGATSTVCSSPCDRAVDTTHRTFTVQATDHGPTPPFAIPAAQRGVVLDYDPSSIGHALGLGLMVVPGAAAAAMGTTLILLDQSGRADFDGTTVPGAIIAGVGAGVIVGGVIVWALTTSDVTISEATKRAAQGLRLDW